MPAKPIITIACGVQEYHLKWKEDEGDAADYGDPAFLAVGPRTFMALMHETDNGDRLSLMPDGFAVAELHTVKSVFSAYDEVGEDSVTDNDETGETDGEPEDSDPETDDTGGSESEDNGIDDETDQDEFDDEDPDDNDPEDGGSADDSNQTDENEG